jgi:oligopeptide/dipeptide ABC transporter ATP-binding protein
MKQRVMMAMNFMVNPALMIADEPTTGLDVSVEAYVLALFKDKVRQYRTSVLYITHNLRILSEIADRVAIMYAGTIVEQAPVEELFQAPLHPYTRALIRCLPEAGSLGEKLQEIPGQVPSIFERTENCKFLPRCLCHTPICSETPPPDVRVSSSHFVLCHNPLERS